MNGSAEASEQEHVEWARKAMRGVVAISPELHTTFLTLCECPLLFVLHPLKLPFCWQPWRHPFSLMPVPVFCSHSPQPVLLTSSMRSRVAWRPSNALYDDRNRIAYALEATYHG